MLTGTGGNVIPLDCAWGEELQAVRINAMIAAVATLVIVMICRSLHEIAV